MVEDINAAHIMSGVLLEAVKNGFSRFAMTGAGAGVDYEYFH